MTKPSLLFTQDPCGHRLCGSGHCSHLWFHPSLQVQFCLRSFSPSVGAYPRTTQLPFLGNSHQLHGSQSVQLSSLAGILTVNVSFGGVPVQDLKTALPPAPVQEPHCAVGQLPKLASFSATGQRHVADSALLLCSAVLSTPSFQHSIRVEEGERIKWDSDKAVSSSGLWVFHCEGDNRF